jgi:uncharacterized protein YuzE
METLNISEKKTKINWDYDADADVLYISFGNPKESEGVDIGDGTIIRIEPNKHEITGITIINPLYRTLSSLKSKPLVHRKEESSIIANKPG